jgi:hypothetical protein
LSGGSFTGADWEGGLSGPELITEGQW